MANFGTAFGGGGAGGGINLTVVGGTTQPENPKENTIWINTDTPIGNVYVQGNEPVNAVDGDVFINSGLKYVPNPTEIIGISVSENPSFQISLASITMYSNTAWQSVESSVFVNGEWKPNIYLCYSYGTVAPIGYTALYNDRPIYNYWKIFTPTLRENNMYWGTQGVSSAYNAMSVVAFGPIDITNFTTVSANGNCTQYSTDYLAYLSVSREIPSTQSATPFAPFVSADFNTTVSTKSISLDDIAGECYICVATKCNGNTTIYTTLYDLRLTR